MGVLNTPTEEFLWQVLMLKQIVSKTHRLVCYKSVSISTTNINWKVYPLHKDPSDGALKENLDYFFNESFYDLDNATIVGNNKIKTLLELLWLV